MEFLKVFENKNNFKKSKLGVPLKINTIDNPLLKDKRLSNDKDNVKAGKWKILISIFKFYFKILKNFKKTKKNFQMAAVEKFLQGRNSLDD